jgi:hypothetical protein
VKHHLTLEQRKRHLENLQIYLATLDQVMKFKKNKTAMTTDKTGALSHKPFFALDLSRIT